MWDPMARGRAGFGVGPPCWRGWGCPAPRRRWGTVRRWQKGFGQAGCVPAGITRTCLSPDVPVMSQEDELRVSRAVLELSSMVQLSHLSGRDIPKAHVSQLWHRPVSIPGPTTHFLWSSWPARGSEPAKEHLSLQPRGTGVFQCHWGLFGTTLDALSPLWCAGGCPCTGPLLCAGHKMAQLKPLR